MSAPAFPHGPSVNERGEYQPPAPGMTLRDWFAGQALNGILAADVPPRINGYTMQYDEAAYAIADAMLAQRAKGGAK